MSITITDTSDPTQKIVLQDGGLAAAAYSAILSDDEGRIGFFKDDTPSTRIYRVRDRMLVGDAAKYTGNRVSANGLGGSKLTENGANWFEKNAQFSVGSAETNGKVGILGYSANLTGEVNDVACGVAGVLVNEDASGRAIYAEAFHKDNADGSSGIEIQVGNYTTNAPVANAYNMGNVEVIGAAIGVEAGHNYKTGDADTPVTAPTQPAGLAIDIRGGSIGASYQKWQTGIVFRDGALARDGSNNAVAVSLAKGHELIWGASSPHPNIATIRSDAVSLANTDVGIIFDNSEVKITGDGEREIISANDVASAVNYWSFSNSSTGATLAAEALGTDVNVGIKFVAKGEGVVQFKSHGGTGEELRISPGASPSVDYFTIKGSASGAVPTLGANGTSTNIDLRFSPKGTGKMRFGTHSAIGAETVTGYIEIKDYSGTTRKLAVVS